MAQTGQEADEPAAIGGGLIPRYVVGMCLKVRKCLCPQQHCGMQRKYLLRNQGCAVAMDGGAPTKPRGCFWAQGGPAAAPEGLGEIIEPQGWKR